MSVATGFAAGGNTRGRQWNGKPVLDTVVLHPHSDVAQPYWASVMQAGDVLVDATCGNGWDTLFMVKALAAAGGGTVVTCDVQEVALYKAKTLLGVELQACMLIESERSEVAAEEKLDESWVLRPTEEFLRTHPAAGLVKVRWVLRNHFDLINAFHPASVRVVAFNLGYLPGGDKAIVTEPEVTLATIRAAQTALQVGGCISCTCYPGHEAGRREEEQILQDAAELPVEIWSCYLHQWINQRNKRTGKRAPSLVLYQRVASEERLV
jgi:hypothetical protein